MEQVYRAAEQALPHLAYKTKSVADRDNVTTFNNMHSSIASSSHDDGDDQIYISPTSSYAIPYEQNYYKYDASKDNQTVMFVAMQFGGHNGRQGKPLVKREVTCWHCGARGHFAGECNTNIAGLPQTPKGAAYFAKKNSDRGEVRPYNAAMQLRRTQDNKSRQQSRERERERIDVDDESDAPTRLVAASQS